MIADSILSLRRLHLGALKPLPPEEAVAAAACTLLTTSTIMAAAAPSSTVQTKAPQTSHVSQNVKAGMLSEVLSLLRMMLICSSAMSPSLRLTTNLGGAATSHQSLQQPIPPPPSSPLVGSILAHYLSHSPTAVSTFPSDCRTHSPATDD